jgi:cyclophilin family peptidyl-prolyl cis-trans isomerase
MTAKKIESDRRRSRPVTKRKKTDAIKKNRLAQVLVIFLIVIIVVTSAWFVYTEFTKEKDYPIAQIDTSMGLIVVELYDDKCPNTCENFIKLANEGFYDGLVFHRVIDDFMIQGGGFTPDGTQKESPYGPIDLEINPDVGHVDGAIGMARTSDPDSATSQFFIDDGAQPNLEPGGVDPDGYAAFGKTIEGMNVVREIASVETTSKHGMDDWPVEEVIINSITIIQ